MLLCSFTALFGPLEYGIQFTLARSRLSFFHREEFGMRYTTRSRAQYNGIDMTGEFKKLCEFDVLALFDALDKKRLEQELSWQQVADQIWEQSSALNDLRHDHPIAVSTIRGMEKRHDISCQHALFMLRWLGQPPEAFLTGAEPREGVSLPVVGPDRRLRWSLRGMYEALDEHRRERKRTWPEVARELHCTPSQLTGLRTAKFATDMGLAMRIVQWLGTTSNAFIYTAKW